MKVLGRLLIALACALLLVPAVPARAERLPVPWDAESVFAGAERPDTVAGANDFGCEPSRRHPRPVVLVHGSLLNAGANWVTMAPLLHNEGFCVFARTFGRAAGDPAVGGVTSMRRSARRLRAFVERVRRATGARRVDLVGHSSGTVMPRWYLHRLGGDRRVRRVVQLAPFWRGVAPPPGTPRSSDPRSVAAQFERGAGAEMRPGSRFLRTVNTGRGPALPSVQYTSIVTRRDQTVPFRAGLLEAPNVRNIIVQDVCAKDEADHIALAFDPLSAQAVLNALSPRYARPLPCTRMTPAGAPHPPRVRLRRAVGGQPGGWRAADGAP